MLKRITILLAIVVFVVVAILQAGSVRAATRYMESLNRGVVAVNVSGSGIYVGWRMFGTDPATIGFNIYRNGVKITGSPIISSTNYMDNAGSTSSTYYITPVIGGVEQAASETVGVWTSYISGSTTPLRFKDVPIQRPADVVRSDGSIRNYSANDCSVGDLDGDGEYEIVLKWDPNDSKDNAQSGYTGNVYLDAYKLNGTRLWRIDLGINIRAGAHYTQFMVYDLDGDGKAEVACRTAPGTVDGMGSYVLMGSDSSTADYRNGGGYILTGPEYLTIFSGPTGANLKTIAFPMPRGSISDWGDNYGNRGDRFLACVAYLDGVRPSLVMCRGYYGPQAGYKGKNQLTALDWRNNQLTQRWQFTATINTGSDIYPNFIGQGNHSLACGDVDGDGYDEIVYGSAGIDHDGTVQYITGLGHGDAMHFGKLNPNLPGLQVFQCHEGGAGESFRDAATGAIIWQNTSTGDNGRAGTADLDPATPGEECWSGIANLKNADGTVNSTNKPSVMNFTIWWDADLSRELFDTDRIDKWDPVAKTQSRLVTVYNYLVSTNNSTKKNPCLQADIFGDWREEFIERTNDSTALRIFTPVTVTNYRIFTLMHDPIYRMGVVWQNVAYNQPPHPGFFLGNGMTFPVAAPDIMLVTNTPDTTPPTPDPMTWQTAPYATSPTTIAMAATAASDVSGVEYYFANLTITDTSHDSGWQNSPQYTDTGLTGNTTYTYIMAARDKSPAQNQGGPSPEASATTLVADTTPPTPNPMMWQLYPYALGTSSITMTASTASDASGVEYYFDCVSGGGHDSGWQSGPTYTDTGLSVGTTYQYAVQARDKSFNLNPTGWSATKAATTYAAGGTTQYQAEDQSWYLSVTETVNAGYTGLSYVNTNNVIGSWVQWAVTVPSAGSYAVGIRFANQPATNRPMSIMVNGTIVIASSDFLTTGAWTTWAINSTNLNLNAGTNTIRLTSLTTNGGPNLDRLDVTVPVSDATAPTPSPMEWVTVPYGASTTSIVMVARTAGDASGVEYMFICTAGGGHSSAWQDSASYTDSGLMPSTTYTYTVQARDKSINKNANTASAPTSATTQTDTTPPSPSPMTFAIAPYAADSTSISMVASMATDIAGVEYMFICTAGGGHNSVWQDSTSYTDRGLMPSTTYTYIVKARDKSVNHTETLPSDPASAMTAADTTPPMPSPMTWAAEPNAVGVDTITMTATTASDISGVEYFFANITDPNHNSAWQDSPTYMNIGLNNNTTYTYAVIARDQSGNHNETGWSDQLSATTLRYVCTSPIVSDLSGNCQVDFMDFALIGNTWAGDTAAWTSLTQFAADWLVCNRNPAGECWQ